MAEQLIGSPHVNTAGPCPSCATPEGQTCSCEPVDELEGLVRELSNVATYAEAGVDVIGDDILVVRAPWVLRALVVIGRRLQALEGRVGRRELTGRSRLQVDPRARARASWEGWDAAELQRELEAGFGREDAPRVQACAGCGLPRRIDATGPCPYCASMSLI